MTMQGDEARARQDRRMVLLFMAAIGLFVLFRSALWLGGAIAAAPGIGGDWDVFGRTVIALERGDIAGIYRMPEPGADVPAEAYHLYYYPPHALLLLEPLRLPPEAARLPVFEVCTLLLLLLAAGWRQPSPWIAAALVVAPTVLLNLLAGQNGFLTAALLVGGLRLVPVRPLLGGILLGLLTFKPQLALLVPFALLIDRRWVTILTACTTTVLLVAASAWAYGTAAWVAWWEMSGAMARHIAAADGGGALDVGHTLFLALRSLGVDSGPALVAQIVLAALLLALFLMGYRHRHKPEPLRLALLLAAGVAVAPYGFAYDLSPLSVAVALVLLTPGLAVGMGSVQRLVLLALWAMPLFLVAMNRHGVPLAPLLELAGVAVLLQRLCVTPAAAPSAPVPAPAEPAPPASR